MPLPTTSDGSEQVCEVAACDSNALIRRAGACGSPDHDQHFLVDDRVVDRIPTYLPEETDRLHIPEIGGGSGVLTDQLLNVAGHVTVIKQDRVFVAHLRRESADEVESDRLTVVEDDTFDVDLPEFAAYVSNLPYGTFSGIPFHLLPRGKPLVLMFQREFGERMAAETGTSEYGRLSVSTQHYSEIELHKYVPREAFDPKPAIQNVVVRIILREPEYEVNDEALFLDFVKALFTQRRKTIRNGIRDTVHIFGLPDPEAVVEAADEGVLRRRASSTASAEFAELTQLATSVGR